MRGVKVLFSGRAAARPAHREGGAVMARFLVEVPHDAGMVPCARVADVFLKTGSHFLTNADWGCRDGVHKAWFIADLDRREEARDIVPPLLRSATTVVQLNSFAVAEIEHLLNQYDV
jgi:hypothetical protein